MSDFYANSYNPDVLSCLANLSNDEVFTPPDIVNKMLDMLPEELFSNPSTTFLDPACKSGVFLREIAKRLLTGLEDEITDLSERIDHIFHNQLYGIAITEMTSLLSRRSVYCSKYPNGKYSIVKFDDPEGNIRFKKIQHQWSGGKCAFCGAMKSEYERDESLETHAYELIHTTDPEEIFNMKFDVIIGNPPYQLSTARSESAQATPIYNRFVDQAKKLNPRHLVMIIPARWFNGGFGLTEFRKSMLNDNKIRIIHDYLNAGDVFAGVEIKGGVCYFLWDRDNEGLCQIFTHKNEGEVVEAIRPLLEETGDTFIRHSEAISILAKVKTLQEQSFMELVSPRDPFGLNYYEGKRERMFKLFSEKPFKDSVQIYSQGWRKEGVKYADRKHITTRLEQVGQYKVFMSKAAEGGSQLPNAILGKPFVGAPGTISNMTYLTIGGFKSEEEANSVASYITTKFFRFLVSLLKNTQDAYRKVYAFVPIQDFSELWTDEKLYTKYGITEEEQAFIESMIRPMDLCGDDNA